MDLRLQSQNSSVFRLVVECKLSQRWAVESNHAQPFRLFVSLDYGRDAVGGTGDGRCFKCCAFVVLGGCTNNPPHRNFLPVNINEVGRLRTVIIPSSSLSRAQGHRRE